MDDGTPIPLFPKAFQPWGWSCFEDVAFYSSDVDTDSKQMSKSSASSIPTDSVPEEGTIAWAKMQPDWTEVFLTSVQVVTTTGTMDFVGIPRETDDNDPWTYNGVIYVQSANLYPTYDTARIGIRVCPPRPYVQQPRMYHKGDIVDITGIMRTFQGERVLLASSITMSEVHEPRPLIWGPYGMNNRSIGGMDFLTGSGGGQAGVLDGFGLNNVGLHIRTWGKVTGIGGDPAQEDEWYPDGQSYYYIDDGSHLFDGTEHETIANEGVRVIYDMNSWTGPKDGFKSVGDYVAMENPSSIEDAHCWPVIDFMSSTIVRNGQVIRVLREDAGHLPFCSRMVNGYFTTYDTASMEVPGFANPTIAFGLAGGFELQSGVKFFRGWVSGLFRVYSSEAGKYLYGDVFTTGFGPTVPPVFQSPFFDPEHSEYPGMGGLADARMISNDRRVIWGGSLNGSGIIYKLREQYNQGDIIGTYDILDTIPAVFFEDDVAAGYIMGLDYTVDEETGMELLWYCSDGTRGGGRYIYAIYASDDTQHNPPRWLKGGLYWCRGPLPFQAVGVSFDGEFLWVVDRYDMRKSAALTRCRVVKFRPMFPYDDDPANPARAWEVAHFYPCQPSAAEGSAGLAINDLNEFSEHHLCGVDEGTKTVIEWGVPNK